MQKTASLRFQKQGNFCLRRASLRTFSNFSRTDTKEHQLTNVFNAANSCSRNPKAAEAELEKLSTSLLVSSTVPLADESLMSEAAPYAVQSSSAASLSATSTQDVQPSEYLRELVMETRPDGIIVLTDGTHRASGDACASPSTSRQILASSAASAVDLLISNSDFPPAIELSVFITTLQQLPQSGDLTKAALSPGRTEVTSTLCASNSKVLIPQPVLDDLSQRPSSSSLSVVDVNTLEASPATKPSKIAADTGPDILLARRQKLKQQKRSGGVHVWRALAAVAVGLAVHFLVPCPKTLPEKSWMLFSIFCTTVAGLVLEPLPVGAWALCCMTGLLLSGSLPFHVAMSGITNESIWLIVIAFFFAKSFETSGLGERIANMFVRAVGQSSLGLSYGLSFAEALMAPALPSSTARAGGIFLPIIKTLSRSAGSTEDLQRSQLGSFLAHVQCQASSQSAAIFLTGAAQNILAISIASQMGVVIPDTWMTWFKGAVVPAVLGMIMIPAMVFVMAPPGMKTSPEAPAEAAARLKQMGPPTRNEIITTVVLLAAVALWVGGDALGLPPVAAAMMALSALLGTGVLTWKGCLEHSAAWDTFLWFAVLMGMCSALSSSGVVTHFADVAQAAMSEAKMHWMHAFATLHAGFFFAHYLFASQVGHVGALYGTCLAMMMAAGVPTTLAALTLGYSASLFGTITHYASGPAAVYYSSGYQNMKEVLLIGTVMGFRSLLTWGVVGMAWWKFLGWW
ncbi:hypothetical protein CEUSTIGMA_g3661.t1 [Chlamydomonas eustigma]|uniref:Uncharacterized protein n=1 Tax=Chlamydomonas eustigma TaxID=1157962 RepID=A0A250WZE9_9CHLO|nr:hypothetical protein CEUSTIGMA_g3661.t1 [Chlamydomonas eustigma]|eukprot:GAX76217.1 hypothetical protein CEUSTIGMA_g3661.t1 [Chlamydomonas eustigma]